MSVPFCRPLPIWRRNICLRTSTGSCKICTPAFSLCMRPEKLYNSSGIGADLLRLADKTFPVPRQIFLVLQRHMALFCAILVRAAEQPGMGCDPGSSKEYFYSAACQANIHLLFNVLIGDRVVHSVNAYPRPVLMGKH